MITERVEEYGEETYTRETLWELKNPKEELPKTTKETELKF